MKVQTHHICGLAALGMSLLAGAQTPAAAPASTQPAPRPALARGPVSAVSVEAAQQAVNVCAGNGFKVAASVVDSAGGVKVLVVGDGAGTRLGDFAIRKAITSLTFKLPTAKVEQQMKTDPAMAAQLSAEPAKFFTRAGGLPLVAGGEIIGAIGVGGAPDSAQDEVCALAALAKIEDRLK